MTKSARQEGELLTPSSLPVPREPKNNFWYQHTEAQTAVVFVHGIFSDSRSCWLSEQQELGEAVFWPDLVRHDPRLNNPSIFMAGYHTAPDAGDFPLNQCSKEVFDALERADASGKPAPMEKQALVFICHSTGGIVVRYLLEKHRERFAQKPVGLVLIASPSLGSGWANFGALAFLYYNQRLGLQLRVRGESLDDLHNRFRDLVNDKARLMPGLFGMEACENKMVLRSRLPAFLRSFLPPRLKVVTAHSAGQYFGEIKTLRDTDHCTAVKPTSLQHPSHEFLINFMQGFRDNARRTLANAAPAPPTLVDLKPLYREVLKLLDENRLLHRQSGPESTSALSDPFGQGSSTWEARKMETLIPNNRSIIRLFEEHRADLPSAVWVDYCAFKLHAKAFADNAHLRLDPQLQPRFPEEFESMLRRELQLPSDRHEPKEADDATAQRVRAFEKTVGHNQATAQLTSEGPLYHVELKNGHVFTVVLVDAVNVDENIFYDHDDDSWRPGEFDQQNRRWLTSMYTVGRNDVTEIVESFSGVTLNYIVTLSSYNQYTSRATDVAESYGIKLMTGDEFIDELREIGA